MAKGCSGNTKAVVAGPSTMVIVPMAIAAMPMGRDSRLNTRIILAIAAMVPLVGDPTISVTITLAVDKAVPGSLRADSHRAVVVAAASAIAQAADARADDAKP
jgi:hypothetical protein